MRRTRDPRHVYGPNLAPMVDVVLVILIFFMASIVFVGPEWFLRAALPAQQAQERTGEADPFALPPPTLSVHVSMLDGSPIVSGLGSGAVALAEFDAYAAKQLAGAAPETINVRLSAAGDVAWQHVVTVQDVLTRQGVRNIALDAP